MKCEMPFSPRILWVTAAMCGALWLSSPVSAQAVSAEQIAAALGGQGLPPDPAAALEMARRGQAQGGEGRPAGQAGAGDRERATPARLPPPRELRRLYPGAEPLPIFGHDLFRQDSDDALAPTNNIPAPADYALGPGDTLDVLIIGERGGRFSLPVSRDGEVNVPQIGPVAVAGLRFPEAKAALEERITSQMSGARASVTLGALRSIQVFVLGDVRKPGAYTVSGLSTISNALLVGGGITAIGSLRQVELKRAGRLVARLDLYDFLTRGDTSRDLRLLPGDVVFVPPVGPVAAIAGGVKRPGIYEFKAGEDRLRDLVALAGGYEVNADRSKATLNRVARGPNRETASLDLTRAADLALALRDGDFLRLEKNLPVVAGEIELAGHLHRPGKRALQPGMKLTDLLGSIDEFQAFPDLGYVFVARMNRVTGEREALSADLKAAWQTPGSAANLALAAEDVIVAFEADRPREELVRCVMRPNRSLLPERDRRDRRPTEAEPRDADEAREQPEAEPPTGVQLCFAAPPETARTDQAPPTYPTVDVGGSLRNPGQYPFEQDMRVSDLLRAGGGLSERAYTLKAELIRYSVDAQQVRRREILTLDLQKLLAGDATADAEVRPYDELSVRVVPEWSTRLTVTLEGEVVFPGTYAIAPGETLRGVIERAGGLKATAFADGAFFSRESLRQRESEQLQRAQQELRRSVEQQQRELVASVRPGENPATAGQLQALLASSVNTAADNPALGRLSIDLEKILAGDLNSFDDLLLRDGDRLLVPPRANEVSVIGEVFAASAHIFEPGLPISGYLDYSGGLRSSADEKAIYIVSASGRARRATSGFFRGGEASVRPGDAIIVPLEIPQVRSPILETLKEVTQIIYNLSLGAAAVHALRN